MTAERYPPAGGADELTSPAALDLLIEVAQLVASSLDLGTTLRRIAQAVVASLGFQAAVVNLVRADGVAVASIEGPREVHEAIGGTVQPLERWLEMLAISQPLGSLRFIDGRAEGEVGDLLSWVPDLPVSDDPALWHPLDALFAPLYGSDGDLIGVLSVDVPVDGRRPGPEQVRLMERFARQAELAMDRARMHQQLTESEELFRRSFEDSPLGMALVDADGSLLRVNTAFATLTGTADPAELPGGSLYDLGHPQEAEAIRAAMQSLIDGERQALSGDVRLAQRRWGRAHAARVESSQGVRVLIHIEDVTEMRRSRDALRRRASMDPLTATLNRDALQQELQRLLDRGSSPLPMGLLFIDLDLFKLINDSHGHRVGDEVLRNVARRIRLALRADDLLCRFGGDEFVVCLTRAEGPAPAIEVAERLLAAVAQPLTIRDVVLHPGASVGITVGEFGSTADIERMLAEADSALYRAKDAGGSRWQLFESWMSATDQARLSLRGELQAALEAEEFRLHYQPVVELDGESVVGYESLLRWQHPARGLLPPAQFLADLFSGPLAAAATDWVIERAVADAAAWPAPAGAPAPWVSVNVIPQQFSRPDFADRVLDCLRRHEVTPGRLTLELTEETVPAGNGTLRQLQLLRDAGVGIAIDDLGSGYSGLLTLRHVPATAVKLDMDFARTVAEPTTAAIVRAVIALAAALDLVVIAEGIETREEAAAMAEMGVRLGQGYLFGRPTELTSPTARSVRAPEQTFVGDVEEERRKLDAALALAADARQVAEVALQAASRVAGTTGGFLARLQDSGRQLALVHWVGFDDEVMEPYREFSIDAPFPMAVAVRSGRPLFWDAAEARQHLDTALGGGEHLLSLAALPLVAADAEAGSRTWGGLAMLWPHLVRIGEPLAVYLLDLAERVGRRLGELAGTA